MVHANWSARTTIQLSLIGTVGTVQIVNVHHFQVTTAQEASLNTDGAAITAGNTLITEWLAAGKASYLALHDTTYRLNLIRAQVLERPGNYEHKLSATESPQTTGNAGVEPGGYESLTSAAVIKWRTTRAGKSYRGRSYLGPVPSSMIAGGQFENVGAQKHQAYLDAMMVAFNGSTGTSLNFRQTIYSRPYNQGEYGFPQGRNPNRTWYYPPDYAGTATDVVGGLLDTVIRSQRRRELGVGS